MSIHVCIFTRVFVICATRDEFGAFCRFANCRRIFGHFPVFGNLFCLVLAYQVAQLVILSSQVCQMSSVPSIWWLGVVLWLVALLSTVFILLFADVGELVNRVASELSLGEILRKWSVVEILAWIWFSVKSGCICPIFLIVGSIDVVMFVCGSAMHLPVIHNLLHCSWVSGAFFSEKFFNVISLLAKERLEKLRFMGKVDLHGWVSSIEELVFVEFEVVSVLHLTSHAFE